MDDHFMKQMLTVGNRCFARMDLLRAVAPFSDARGAAGAVDPTFDPGSGINDQVNAVAAQPDGKVIIGGSVTTVRGVSRHHFCRHSFRNRKPIIRPAEGNDHSVSAGSSPGGLNHRLQEDQHTP